MEITDAEVRRVGVGMRHRIAVATMFVHNAVGIKNIGLSAGVALLIWLPRGGTRLGVAVVVVVVVVDVAVVVVVDLKPLSLRILHICRIATRLGCRGSALLLLAGSAPLRRWRSQLVF